ncbi:class II 3-deoxy-7-phosphoheptulonate synthase [Sphaerisporangium dianthi]|uniref:Phospho-2-dehydro-3-deoxyheptonate aldolase n=1 Tax=Sphaerisporangium dianthi TaxID=1436120 RepID=A0ABV9CJX0_9ACTN
MQEWPGPGRPKECDRLRERLAAVAAGEAFVLQGGDSAETFAGISAEGIRNKLETLLQMAVVLTYAGSMPVVKIGRMAGQFAKPRSSGTETVDGRTLPSYRGDAVNRLAFDAEARTPDPRRLWRTYQASGIILNLVRAFTGGGYASLDQLHAWNRDFFARSPAGARYEEPADEIDNALAFMRACGVDPQRLRSAEFFSSHEGLLLDYEAALTRLDARGGRFYASSAHMLWVGERTRDPGGAHIAYFAGIDNPVGVKLGPDTTAEDVRAYIGKLDPQRRPGRLTFIVRMGARLIRDTLPPLVRAAQAEGAKVVWVCDPMHGNTFTAPSGHKTRLFSDIMAEVEGLFEVHRSLGSHPGGIHVELTGEDVTECIGGGSEILLEDLAERYESACDPRLNRSQSLDLAFQAGTML